MSIRWLALALLAVLAACAAPAPDDDAVAQYGDPSASSTTLGAGDSPGGGGGGRGGPRSAAQQGSDVAVEDLQVEDQQEGGQTPPTSAPSRLAEKARGPVGGFAASLLRPTPATTILIEVSQQTGAAPLPSTVAEMIDVLGDVSDKPVMESDTLLIESSKTVWSSEDINATADAATRTPQGDRQAVVRVLFLSGRYSASDSVLGVATRGDVFAIFVERVVAAETPVVGRGQIETAVAIHELGHVLGLVDIALDTGREDPEHPGHSRNRGSVMYWAVESSLITQVLGGGPPRTFDAEDLADLSAIRNGE